MTALVGAILGSAAVTVASATQASGCSGLAPKAVSSDYPGCQDDGLVIEYGLHWLKAGLYTYYELHGEWPGSWTAVVADALVQVPLVTPENREVDPDDPNLDFYGDMYYFPPQPNESQVRIAFTRDVNGLDVRYCLLDPPATIEAKHRVMIEMAAPENREQLREHFTSRLNSPEWLKRVAIGSMLKRGITLYRVVHGHSPYTWEAYVGSGLAPIAEDSINPLTGSRFKGDGSAGDYLYQYYSEEQTGEDHDAIRFTHLEADGSLPAARIMY